MRCRTFGCNLLDEGHFLGIVEIGARDSHLLLLLILVTSPGGPLKLDHRRLHLLALTLVHRRITTCSLPSKRRPLPGVNLRAGFSRCDQYILQFLVITPVCFLWGVLNDTRLADYILFSRARGQEHASLCWCDLLTDYFSDLLELDQVVEPCIGGFVGWRRLPMCL